MLGLASCKSAQSINHFASRLVGEDSDTGSENEAEDAGGHGGGRASRDWDRLGRGGLGARHASGLKGGGWDGAGGCDDRGVFADGESGRLHRVGGWHSGGVDGAGWVGDRCHWRGVERWFAVSSRCGLERLRAGGALTVGGSRGDGASSVRRSGGGRGRRGDLVVRVRDSELSGVLVLARVRTRLDNELDAVAGGTLGGLEAGGWGPDVGAAVGGALGNDTLQLQVGRWALEEEKRDWALGGGVPGDGEALAGGNERVQAWL